MVSRGVFYKRFDSYCRNLGPEILGPAINNFIRLVIQTSVIVALRMSLSDEYVCTREYHNKTLVDSMATESIQVGNGLIRTRLIRSST